MCFWKKRGAVASNSQPHETDKTDRRRTNAALQNEAH